MLNTTEASLKGIRAGNGTVYGHGVNPLCQKFPEGRGRTNLPSILPFFSSFTSTRVAKEDLLPSVDLVGIEFSPEKQEERMDE